MRRLWITFVALCAAFCLVSPPARAAGADEYRIDVDIANQIATVYRQSDGSVARQMVCSTGADGTTPRGTFRLQKSRAADRSEWYFIGQYQCYVKYPTRIQGSILFHSLPYADMDMDTIDPQAVSQLLLGEKASHGCVRLRWQDARWIAENCPDGTETHIFTGARDGRALRQLLLKGSYSAEDGADYEGFTEPLRDAESDALSRGDAGEDVQALQNKLGLLGYFEGRLTGEYDTATAVAVMRWQIAQGLCPTGFITPAQVGRIMAE